MARSVKAIADALVLAPMSDEEKATAEKALHQLSAQDPYWSSVDAVVEEDGVRFAVGRARWRYQEAFKINLETGVCNSEVKDV